MHFPLAGANEECKIRHRFYVMLRRGFFGGNLSNQKKTLTVTGPQVAIQSLARSTFF